MDLDSAISKHAEWKIKLRTGIVKKEKMDAATIAKDNCCDLGKWLHSEAKSKFGQLASHADCVAKHKAFHLEAGKVAAAINAEKFTEAEAMLGTGKPYASASSAVTVSIMRLKKEAGI